VHPEGHRALEHITLHRQLSVLPPQPLQLRTLALDQRAVAVPRAARPLPRAPVAQRALGVRPDTSTMPAAGPVETATGTTTGGTSPGSASVNAVPTTPLATSPDAPDEPR